MPRIFAGYSEVEKAVDTLVKVYKETGGLPPELVEALKQSLKHSYKGCIIYFYQLLAEKCTNALKYF